MPAQLAPVLDQGAQQPQRRVELRGQRVPDRGRRGDPLPRRQQRGRPPQPRAYDGYTNLGNDTCSTAGSGRRATPARAGSAATETFVHALCCAPSPTCGDGVVNGVEEECDDGNQNESTSASTAARGACRPRTGSTASVAERREDRRGHGSGRSSVVLRVLRAASRSWLRWRSLPFLSLRAARELPLSSPLSEASGHRVYCTRASPAATTAAIHLLGALVTLARLVERDLAVEVHEDAVAAVLLVDLVLVELAQRLAAGDPAAGAVVDREAAAGRAGLRHQDVAVVAVGSGDQDRVPGVLPDRAAQGRMSAGNAASRPCGGTTPRRIPGAPRPARGCG